MDTTITHTINQIGFKYNKSFEINSFKMLKYSIRNCKKLNEYELLAISRLSDAISRLSDDEKMEIIKLYNMVLSSLVDDIIINT
jgi:hypothetical protein